MCTIVIYNSRILIRSPQVLVPACINEIYKIHVFKFLLKHYWLMVKANVVRKFEGHEEYFSSAFVCREIVKLWIYFRKKSTICRDA